MKSFPACVLAAALMLASEAATAEQPTQLIVPFDPGSSTDVVARAMQPTLSAKLGQNVLVINKAGASGTLGAAELARAKPDGKTIAILGMAGIAMVPHFRKLGFDLGSFDYICQVYSAPVIVMVAPDSPFKDIRALLEFGKANPGKLFYGSPGIGTPDHINIANFLRQNGVTGTHVPFSGGGAVSQAILSNQIVAVSNTTVLLNAYRLRPLAVLADKRLPELPDVPAAGEFGPPIDTSGRSWPAPRACQPTSRHRSNKPARPRWTIPTIARSPCRRVSRPTSGRARRSGRSSATNSNASASK